KLIRSDVSEVSILGRRTQGVRVLRVEEGERVVSVASMREVEDENGNGAEDNDADDNDAPGSAAGGELEDES
ncbi:MAG: DNA gyrase C-terminal beta-propeller domain-containing protein, partial [Alphaproteobacteria bacterium]